MKKQIRIYIYIIGLILILFFYKEEDLDFLNRKGKHGRDNRN